MSLRILSGLVLVAALLTAGWQRIAISRTRAANETLRQQSVAAASAVVTEPSQASSHEIAALQEANRDLPKLRNEVRRLRDEKREFERLQTENERLAATLKARPKATAPRMSEAEGFVLREKWTHAGFATPEATVQTFFWALANKDVRAWAHCMSGKDAEKMVQQMQESTDGGATRMERKFAEVAEVQGFRVAEKKQVAEDKVELGLQAAAGGHVMSMRLQLVDGEWRFSN